MVASQTEIQSSLLGERGENATRLDSRGLEVQDLHNVPRCIEGQAHFTDLSILKDLQGFLLQIGAIGVAKAQGRNREAAAQLPPLRYRSV
jgi:hypothetical protein